MKRKFHVSAAVLLVGCALGAAAPRKETELAPEEARQLKQDKVLITRRSYNQIFTPYIFSPMPVFITTDSLLNAWHVLLEESFAQVEERFSVELPGALDRALVGMREAPYGMKPEVFEKARRHALIVLGTAAKLSGGTWSGGADLDALIAGEVRLVEAAEGLHLPAWLPPTADLAGIDYAVFKPTGFYTRSERMQRYFRAVRWLQSIPFRLERDDEMAAMVLLAPALGESVVTDIAELHQSLGGAPADADVLGVFHRNPYNSLEGLLKWKAGRKNQLTRMVVLSAMAGPDVKLFQRTTSEQRPFPNGLEIAAWMGSPMALDLLKPDTGGKVLRQVVAGREMLESARGIYGKYLQSLGLLLAAPEPDAPAFMKSLTWRRKSLNTALAGWAQLRHTWALQAKDDANYFPAGYPYPGFVEPNPEFFHGMGLLIAESTEAFDACGSLGISPQVLAAEAGELVILLEKVLPAFKQKIAPLAAIIPQGRELTTEELAVYDEAAQMLEPLFIRLNPLVGVVGGVAVSGPPLHVSGIRDPEQVLTDLREIAAGKRGPEILELIKNARSRAMKSRWKRLLEICHQLESLAHKQLRGVEPTKEEKGFIVDYGEKLGGIMFYDGNSYHNPRNDAPRIATVFNQPGGQCLLAGVGRPREIRVLYPWKGKEMECRGAVMPYYEFRSDTRLTDEEWKQRLDGKKAPVLPSWVRPILSEVPAE